MKRTINGIRYNTVNASLIGGTSGPAQWAARLYRTPQSGRPFLVVEGAPMSLSGTILERGEKLIPLTDDEARRWAAEYL